MTSIYCSTCLLKHLCVNYYYAMHKQLESTELVVEFSYFHYMCLLIEKCTFQPIHLQPRLVSHANITHFRLDTHQIQRQGSTETRMLGVIDSWV